MGKLGDLWVRLGLKKDEFTAGLDQAQKQTQSFSQKVGAHFKNLATQMLAVGTAVNILTKALASAAKNIIQFERANSELAAVLGTNLKGVRELSQSARELGRTSEFTASEVTSLQIALARLGFDRGQIKDMQGSILDFALAMGTDLASAAEFTGASLRAFGLQATDTRELLDVMSASTTNSALNFSKLQTSVSVVAPIAKSFGLGVKETAAFLGVLANNGFDASSAATALRNILLNLADGNGKLAQGIGHSARSFDEIIRAFRELRERGIEVDQVLEMTDKRSASAAAALINMGDEVARLKGKLDDSQGSLDKMAETMGNNVAGSIKRLQSAWEDLTLAFSNSAGPFKVALDAISAVVNKVTEWIDNGTMEKIIAIARDLSKVATQGFASGVVAGVGDAIKFATEEKPEAPKAPEAPRHSVVNLMKNIHADEAAEAEAEAARKAREAAERAAAEAEKQQKAWKALQQAAREAGQEAGEVAAADEEYAARESELLKEFERVHELQPIQPFDNATLAASADYLRDAIKNGEELIRLAPRLSSSMNDAAQSIADDFENLGQKTSDLEKAIAELLVQAIEDGLVGAFNALADVIGGVTDGDMASVAKALLEPLADMAVKAGMLIMMSGEAIEALKTGFIDFVGGNPIVAGAALVAVGLAAKAGLAAIGNRGSGATTVSSYGNQGAYGAGAGTISSELTVNVVGTIKGSDIILSSDNTLKGWNR